MTSESLSQTVYTLFLISSLSVSKCLQHIPMSHKPIQISHNKHIQKSNKLNQTSHMHVQMSQEHNWMSQKYINMSHNNLWKYFIKYETNVLNSQVRNKWRIISESLSQSVCTLFSISSLSLLDTWCHCLDCSINL